MTLVFGRISSFFSAASNHLVSKVLWRLTNAFTLLLIVAVIHQIGGELHEGYRKWSDASPERVLNEALTKLQHEPSDDVLAWYAGKSGQDPDVAGLELGYEAIDIADKKINFYGFQVLLSVAEMEGDYQAQTLAYIGLQYFKGDFVVMDKARAVEYLTRAHELGHAEASTRLALAYYLGDGVPKDPRKSLEFFELAINAGDTGALWRRGVFRVTEGSSLYALDEGVEDLRRAAAMGNADAAEMLAMLHIDGVVEKDLQQVRNWMEQAVGDGLYSTAEHLARYQLEGVGGPINAEAAINTLSSASKFAKHNRATAFLGSLYLDGYYWTYEQRIDPDIPLGLETLERGVSRNCSICAWVLGDYYLTRAVGDVGAQQKGHIYLKMAAKLGFDKAQAQLAKMFMLGDGVEKDFDIAYELAGKAAAQMNTDGIWLTGTMHYLGLGRRVNETIAFEFFKAASELGDIDAKERVGHMLFEGEGVAMDKAQALPLILEAASAGNELAIFKAAKIHFFGDGVEQDFVKAASYYRQLAESGQAKSQLALATTYLLLAKSQPELTKYAHMWAELAARQDHDAAADWRTEFAGKSEFEEGLELADACWKSEFVGCEPEFNFEKMNMEELWKGKESKVLSLSS